VLRTREFLMKDSYTLDRDVAGLDRAYVAHAQAYRRIFDRCGLRYYVVQSDVGMMGGLGSHEFMAPSAAGEDDVALCAACGYAANVELARGVPARPTAAAGVRGEVSTPDARTAAEVAAALGIDLRLVIKTLVYVGARQGPFLALVRGDHTIHERKLSRALGGEEFRAAHPDEIRAWLGASIGSIGPLDSRLPVLADEALQTGAYVVGATRDGVHVRGVVPGRDFPCRFVDLHTVAGGEACVECGQPLGVERVIEVGNIFKLGTKYSTALGAAYLDEDGQQKPVVMGSYGIGPARIAAAAIEQLADQDGIVWPPSIAPFQVHIVAVNVRDQAQATAAEETYVECWKHGIEALLDDRDERPGVKFKDADLLGMPLRVTVGNAYVRDGLVELRERRTRRETRVGRPGLLEALRCSEALRPLA
jgi:prolyl-tRNA synthetase